MSAPTALEYGALARGIAWMSPASSEPRPVLHGHDRRSGDLLTSLSREHDDLCRQASDPLEIAAVLEAAGVTDSRARSEFHSAGVFEVAERLWSRVPWRPVPHGARSDRWRLPLWRSQVRGFLYALPALIAAAVPSRLGSTADYLVIAVATALAIAAAQALSVLGHILTGRGQSRAVSQLSTVALVAATGLTLLGVGVCAALGRPAALALIPGSQLVFVVGATLLMVAGHERLLVLLIAPGALAIGLQLGAVLLPARILGRIPVPVGLSGGGVGLLGAAAGAVLLTAVGAWLRLRTTRDGEPLRRAVGRVELSHATVAGLYGLGLSALISFAVIGVATGRVHGSGVQLIAVTVPMTATIGMSEYLLHRARNRCLQALGREHRVGGFATSSLRQLRAMVGLHAAIVGGVAGLVLFELARGHVDPAMSGYAVGYAVLSIALLLSTTLLSLGYAGLAAALACGGGALLTATTVLPGVQGQTLVVSQLGVLAVLLIVAYRLTAVRFVTVSVHR